MTASSLENRVRMSPKMGSTDFHPYGWVEGPFITRKYAKSKFRANNRYSDRSAEFSFKIGNASVDYRQTRIIQLAESDVSSWTYADFDISDR